VSIPLNLLRGNDFMQAKPKNVAFGPLRLRGRPAGDRRCSAESRNPVCLSVMSSTGALQSIDADEHYF
jgi:hypothetical protein